MQVVRVGNVEIAPILDTPVLMNPPFFMPDHAEELVAEWGHTANERGLLPMSITTFLIRSAGKTYLVDTGIGVRRRPGFPIGRLDQHLEEAGVTPDEIDFVIHSHLHIDHVGWNTVPGDNGETRFFFPKATHLIAQVEWDYWTDQERLKANDCLVECVLPLAGAGRIAFKAMDAALDENLVFVPTPGHTPGHVAIGISSAGERGIIVGDASHHQSQLNHPDWSPPADADPRLSAVTRERLMADAEGDGRTWFAGHWPFPGTGQIVRLEGKRVFRGIEPG
jgi:glyoxylase-like metal-dependent hydrolase (beta-lactamase superfamily II)